jgi:hypothetical protein
MFGGLELKEASGGSGGTDKDPAATAILTDSTSSSSFGFLNTAAPATSTEPVEAVDPDPSPLSSGFSFLNADQASIATVEAEAPSAPPSAPSPVPSSSGFSFLQPPEPAAATTTTAPVVEPSSASGFSFLIPSQEDAGEQDSLPQDSLAQDAPEVPAETTNSAFDFLMNASSSTEKNADTATLGRDETIASGSTVGKVVPPEEPLAQSQSQTTTAGMATTTTTTTTTVSVGSGITFAPPSAAGTVRGERKTRARRAQPIGIGAHTPTVVPTPTVPTPTTLPTPSLATSSSLDSSDGSTRTRTAATEAARRAEDFMSLMERQEQEKQAQAQQPPDISDIATVESTDDVLAAAQAAAEEYKAMQSKVHGVAGNNNGGSSATNRFMGGLVQLPGLFGNKGKHSLGNTFRTGSSSGGGGSSNSPFHSRASPPTTTSASSSTHGNSTSTSTFPAATTPAPPSTTTSTTGSTSGNGSAIQPQQQQQQQFTTSSTATSSFEPPTLGASSSSFSPPKMTAFVPTTTTPVPTLTFQKKKTPNDRVNDLQANFCLQVTKAMAQVYTLRSQRRLLLEEQFVAIAKERLSIQQIDQAETQLQTAAAQEDYELADQLECQVRAHETEKSEVSAYLLTITHALNELTTQKASVVQGVADCFDRLAVQLQRIQMEQESQEQVVDTESMKKFAAISKQLSAEDTRLEQDFKHLERDEQLVAEERQELETAISEESGEIEIHRSSTETKLQKVQEEIVALRQLLQEKQQQAADLRTEQYGLDDQISKVRVKFSRQLTRVSKKEYSLKDNRHDWETEQASLTRQRQAHEYQVQTHSQALLEHDQFMVRVKSECRLCKEFTQLWSHVGFCEPNGGDDNDNKVVVDDNVEEEEETATSDKDGNEDDDASAGLAQLQANVVKAEAAASEAKIVLKVATAALKNLESERLQLSSKIPELEAAKKAAAAKRDFRAASNASKEIKDATARLKECEEELTGEAAQKQTVAQQELQKCQAEYEVQREIAQAKESLTAKAQMKRLAAQIQQLVQTKQELASKGLQKNNSNGINDDDNKNSVQRVGALVLDGQIKALKEDGNALGIKHGGWVDLMKDILPNDEDDDAEDAEPSTDSQPTEELPAVDSASNGTINAGTNKSAVPAADKDQGLSSEERVANVRKLMQRIKKAEEELEAAAAREDFDQAATLHETFENLQMDLEQIDLTDAEMELAFAAGEGDSPVQEEEETDAPERSQEADEDDHKNDDCNEAEPEIKVGNNDEEEAVGNPDETVTKQEMHENQDSEQDLAEKNDIQCNAETPEKGQEENDVEPEANGVKEEIETDEETPEKEQEQSKKNDEEPESNGEIDRDEDENENGEKLEVNGDTEGEPAAVEPEKSNDEELDAL